MASLLSPEQQQRIAILRQKMAADTITIEEMQEVVLTMRQGRLTAAAASDSSKKKKAVAAIPNADDMLGELEGL